MRVFLSWSGQRSAAIARALREWLPTVIQAVEPWMSESNIDKGARWSSEIAGQLEAAQVGIMCLTPDNISSPWLHFEAGALSKALQKSRVCTYLLGIEPTDLGWPLAMFQATRANEKETKQLLVTINKALEGAALPAEWLDRTFERWWPELKDQIEKAPQGETAARTSRSDRELLEEILELQRDRRVEEQARLSPARLQEAVIEHLQEVVRKRVRKLEPEMTAVDAEIAALQKRLDAINERSSGDSDGQAKIELAREREAIDAAMRDSSARLESVKSAMAEINVLNSITGGASA
jgi:TIR domain